MRAYQADRQTASRNVVVTPYHPDEAGEMVAAMPSEGPCRAHGDRACRLVIDHRRERKTGPQHPLTVVYCATHRRAFTLYPPGHVPYGRESVLSVGPDGGQVLEDESDARAPVERHFAGTVFQAALDAAAGRAWDHECLGGTDRWWTTQTRRLAELVRWVGLGEDLEQDKRLQIAEALEVELLLLLDGIRRITESPGYRSRGESVGAVLEAVVRGPCVLDRLLLAGHLAGRWGVPLSWDPAAQVLRSPVFSRHGARPPP